MTLSAGICAVRCQPAVETFPPRVSTLTITRSRNAPSTSSRQSMSLKAAVPRITRSAPARSASRPGRPGAAARRRGAHPAAVLDRHRQLVRDPLEVVEALGRTGPRAVEVDDVQEPRAGLHPRARGLDRRVAVDGLRVEVAPDEPDRLPLGDVDRRIEDHGTAVTP